MRMEKGDPSVAFEIYLVAFNAGSKQASVFIRLADSVNLSEHGRPFQNAVTPCHTGIPLCVGFGYDICWRDNQFRIASHRIDLDFTGEL